MTDEDYAILKHYRDGRNGPLGNSQYYGAKREALMQAAFSLGYSDHITPPHEFIEPQAIVDKVREVDRRNKEYSVIMWSTATPATPT